MPAGLPSDARVSLKNAQRRFCHAYIEVVRADGTTSDKNFVWTVRADRSLANLGPPGDDISSLIRPDGFVVTAAHGSRED